MFPCSSGIWYACRHQNHDTTKLNQSRRPKCIDNLNRLCLFSSSRTHGDLCRVLCFPTEQYVNAGNRWPSSTIRRSTPGICPWDGVRSAVERDASWGDLHKRGHPVLGVLQERGPHQGSPGRRLVPHRYRSLPAIWSKYVHVFTRKGELSMC